MTDRADEIVEDEVGGIWEKLDDEPGKVYRAFLDYCQMGAGRSLTKLQKRYQSAAEALPLSDPVEPPTKRLQTLKTWSVKWDWQRRVEAWDKAQQEAEDALWRERQLKIREQDWETGTDLRDLVDTMLREGVNFIKTKRRFIKGDPEKGVPDREIITMALDGQFLVKAAEAASKLQRLAAGMPDSATEVSGEVKSVGSGNDFSGLSNLSTEQLEAFARGLKD